MLTALALIIFGLFFIVWQSSKFNIYGMIVGYVLTGMGAVLLVTHFLPAVP
jgi:hydrogenase-4 membrane subunit HyfE